MPRSRSDDGKTRVGVDFSELRYRPRPRIGRQADPIAASMAKIDAFRSEAFKAEIARLEAQAAVYKADFERERERADRLAVELLQAAAETSAANEWAARLEDEVATLRTGRRTGGSIAGQAALRLGRLAASIVESDRAACR
ncbi:hypothetical protein [Bradyrhizobium sp. UFLA05-112]